MGELLLLADDFTGSGDAGVQMTKNGIEAHIVFDTKSIDPDKSYVIDSESRNIPGDEAYLKVKNILEELKDVKFEHYYKKIDSTLRGNIKRELQAVDEVLKPEIIVFNPANPDSNRTVVDGTLMMNNVRITETEIIRDPLCLVTEDNLKTLMEKEMKEPVTHFYLNQVRNKNMDIGNSRIITFDVLTNSDLDNVVEYVLSLNKKVLWVGSAGMANALVKVMHPKHPVLALVGSISETSRRQVNVAMENGAKVVEMNIADILNGDKIEPIAKSAIYLLRAGYDVVVVTAKTHEDYLEAVSEGKKRGMSRKEIAKYTQDKIGELSTLILKEAKVCGCFLTGGDTAISVNNYNHAHGAKLVEEVLPIVALIELEGGDHPGLPCIVKGGSIGDNNTLVDAIKYFKQSNY